MKVRCFNIKWDTDGDIELADTLPVEIIVEFDDGYTLDEIEEELADKLSDLYGYCMFGFEYEIVSGPVSI